MSRELAPHGSAGAYRRHLRRGEPACEQCLAGERERKAASRYEQAPKLVEVPPVEASVDALAEALDSLAIVKAALHASEVPIQTIPALAKRRDELVDRIKALSEGEQEERVSVVDEITARRRRRANASG